MVFSVSGCLWQVEPVEKVDSQQRGGMWGLSAPRFNLLFRSHPLRTTIASVLKRTVYDVQSRLEVGRERPEDLDWRQAEHRQGGVPRLNSTP